jgi:hypothetical protein
MKYDYIQHGLPIVDEGVANLFFVAAAVYAAESACGTDLSIFKPEYRNEVLCKLWSEAVDEYIDFHTRRMVWGVRNVLLPQGFCSTN